MRLNFLIPNDQRNTQKLSHTKIAIAVMAIFASGAALADGVNFSNLSVGTVTNLAISQTGDGRGRISSGGRLTATQGADVAGTGARGVTFSRVSDGAGAFVHSGTLSALSLTQVNTAASGGSLENAITGAMYTTGTGSVTVNQGGKGNVVDFALGTDLVAVATPTISIIQKGDNNQTELTRTGVGSNTDTIASYGNSNTVLVTGSATGSNSVNLTFGSDAAATSSNNQATVSQTGSDNAFTAQVTGSTNILDVGQSATSSALTLTGITGSSNYLYARQSGSANTATISAVTGDSNKLDLIQSGTTTAATISIDGSSNNVDVMLSGGTGTATLALTGSGNNVGITQSAASTGATASITLAATSATVTILQQTAGASYTYSGTIPTSGSLTVTQ